MFEFLLYYLSYRELALLVWIFVVVVCFIIQNPHDVFDLFTDFIKAFLQTKLLSIWVFFGVYTFIQVNLLSSVNLFNFALMKDFFVCIIFIGFSSILLAIQSSNLHLIILSEIKIALFTEFLVNAYTFSFWTEFILVPVFIFSVTILAYAEAIDKCGNNKNHHKVVKLMQFIVICFALSMICKSVLSVDKDFFTKIRLQEFLLPLSYSITLIPFLFCVKLFAEYDNKCMLKKLDNFRRSY